ncbi:hypothetical protein ACGFMM_25470 [Streptomyces sp. NPDC048604]|uniref:hypothetical protein n=1 Tax=Streptomyces sp. NPDC048604 TaxID=3365578 RepID=UPI0037161AF3
MNATDPRIERLVVMLDDLEADVDETIDLADEITEAGDETLLPALEAALTHALNERNSYAREVLGGMIGALGGADTLPVLVRASSVDLGDDQDGLATEIAGLVAAEPDRARTLLQPLLKDENPEVAGSADWALRFAG